MIDKVMEQKNLLKLNTKLLSTISSLSSKTDLQYQKTEEKINDILIWFYLNKKELCENVKIEKDNQSISLMIDGIKYQSSNPFLLEIIKKDIETNNNRMSLYIPTKEELQNSIHENTVNQVHSYKKNDDNSPFSLIFETKKEKNTFLYSTYMLDLIEIVSKEKISCVIYLFPLIPYKNKINPKCCAIVETGGYIKKYEYFEQNNNHIINLEKYDIKIQCFFSDTIIKGVFITGETYENNTLNNLNYKEECFSPKNQIGYGHICYPFKNNIIHVFPLKLKNNAKGQADSLILLEKNNFITNHYENINFINIDGEEKEIINYWSDETFVSDILF